MTGALRLYHQFSFENSGLPDHPTVRKAHELMLKCEIEDSPIHYKEAGIQRDINLARYVAESGWSSDPDVIAAALLRGAYTNADTLRGAFGPIMGERVTNLVRETEDFEAGVNPPYARKWTPDAKTIIYADCTQALARWNDSLSKSFHDVAERGQGQIIDPQYLGAHKDLVNAVDFIKQDLAANGAPSAQAAAAVDKALKDASPVAQSIAAQAEALSKTPKVLR